MTQTAPRGLMVLALALVCASAWSCGEGETLPAYGDVDPRQTDTEQEEPIAFSTTPYTVQGPASIAELYALFPSPADVVVWQGFEADSPYPVSPDCQPDRNTPYTPVTLPELPKTIEGIITLHPRLYQKRAICDNDERFYGSFIIQDATAGIVVLRDSRLTTFTYGDRVRLRVRGLMLNAFPNGGPFYTVQLFDQVEVIERAQPIYYEALEREFTNADIGLVKRVRGKIVLMPDNNNFGEMELADPDDPSVTWFASLDSELSKRRPEFKLGDTLEITGPVLDNFGLRIMIASFGQITKVQ